MAYLQPTLTSPFLSPLPLQKTSVLIMAPSISVPKPMKISFIPLWPVYTELTETEKCFTPKTMSRIGYRTRKHCRVHRILLKAPKSHHIHSYTCYKYLPAIWDFLPLHQVIPKLKILYLLLLESTMLDTNKCLINSSVLFKLTFSRITRSQKSLMYFYVDIRSIYLGSLLI